MEVTETLAIGMEYQSFQKDLVVLDRQKRKFRGFNYPMQSRNGVLNPELSSHLPLIVSGPVPDLHLH